MKHPLATKSRNAIQKLLFTKRSKLFINAVFAILLSQPLFAQNILSEDFDSGTFPPTGWDNSIYSTTSGCPPWAVSCQWADGTSGMGWPGAPTHSGTDMAYYNSSNLDFGDDAELATPAMDFSPYAGSGFIQVSFWMYRDVEIFGRTTDSVAVYVNTSPTSAGGTRLGAIMRDASFPPTVSSSDWYQYAFPVPTSFSGTTNYVIFVAYSAGYSFDMYLDDVSIDHIPPCSGKPNITGVSPSGTYSTCPGFFVPLTVSADLAGDLGNQWQSSSDGGATWNNITNDTNLTVTPFVTSELQYRMIQTCRNSGQTDTSDVVDVAPSSAITYATLPYTQDFESWSDRCDDQDVPDYSWTNNPSSGDLSWRRDDQGYSDGGWSFSWSSGDYSPASAVGDHSARFHNIIGPTGVNGSMYLYADCSAPGSKELRFYYNNLESSGDDSLEVDESDDNGVTFSRIGVYFANLGWTLHTATFNANSANAIIRFTQYSDWGSYDIGLDYVQVLPPCDGKPTAGTLAPAQVCANQRFTMMLSGSSLVANLKYQWQSSTDGTTWADIVGDSALQETTSIAANTYFRCVVTCRASGLSDTSNAVLYTLKPFYYCYCNPNPPGTYDNADDNIGNVTLTAQPSGRTLLNNGTWIPVLNNPSAVNGYSNFDTLTPMPVLYLDSLYQASVAEISQNDSWDYNSAPLNIYIDYNHNGVFDADELVFDKTTSGDPSTPNTTDTFRVPGNAKIGTTGMRVILGVYESSPLDPCGTGGISGEFEDYLININYRPCDGPVNAGRTIVADSGMCVGYPFVLTDTTYEKRQDGITWQWQMSPDGGTTWGDVGPANKDTLTQIFATAVSYRMKMTCLNTAVETHSNVVNMFNKPPYACYCYSIAEGGKKTDSSDVGGFSFASYTSTVGGPHLLNPAAVNGRKDNTDNIIDLYPDSTYTASLYYILKSATDGGAKVTMFIDYNANHTYDIPDERVWSTAVDAASWYISANITIPTIVATDVLTGMRLIVNNNSGANIPSDDACGGYTSGETQDFVVRFNNNSSSSVGSLNGITNLALYPNPTTGKFKVLFNSTNTVKSLQINVTNMTGQQVLQRDYQNVSGQFATDLDLTAQPRGLYFIEFISDGSRMIRKLVVE